uniref:TauD domain-containing protein n=1 Tax=Heterorhabditis bacteriophora TaxID=37862 RepID=A0A1I7W7F8_HETBA
MAHLHQEKASQLYVPLVWLRDHCQNPQCYNKLTNQRKSNTVDLINKACITGDACITVEDQQRLLIHWADDLISEFTADGIINTSITDHHTIPKDIFMWNKRKLLDIPRIHISKYEFAQFCEMIIKYGVVIIDGVEKTASATEKLCREITTIHDTYFGAFWIFSNKSQEKGVDYYVYCFSKQIDHHYLEGGPAEHILNTITREKPVIQLDSYGNVTQIRFNPYDRAPFRSLSTGVSSASSARSTIAFYHAYTTFSKICHDPRNSVSIALRPGSVIFIDNFRVLHSRTEFKGWRQMAGCYLSRDNFLAKARPFLPENLRRFV